MQVSAFTVSQQPTVFFIIIFNLCFYLVLLILKIRIKIRVVQSRFGVSEDRGSVSELES